MKKKIVFTLIVCMCLSFVLGACGNVKTEKKIAKKETDTKVIKPNKKQSYHLNQEIDFLGLHVTFVKTTMVQDEKGKKDVLKVDMKVKNNSTAKRSFTSINMKITDKDHKKLRIYPGENIGEKIKPSKTVTGSAYFRVNGKAPYTITYQDQASDVQASWKVEE